MPTLDSHKALQKLRTLPFCYLCGKEFATGDRVDHDHVPPKTTFRILDRHPVLKLKTHKACNAALSVEDKKIGQLIALRRYERPASARDHVLHFSLHSLVHGIAVENLDVDEAVYRWVRGFHAALYRQPLIGEKYAITTPFPRADKTKNGVRVRPVLPQHSAIVETIKTNRAFRNLDSIVINRSKLTYECVWCQTDGRERWLCCFALDIYNWKDLGSHTADIPARGCAGLYSLADGSAPADATLNRESAIIIPNIDKLDPFGR